MQQEDTISAIATAGGEAGIGIVRISGRTALSVADRIFRAKNGKRLSDMESHRAVYGTVTDDEGRPVDEAMALIMRSPHSYTKEDVVELQCHGGRLVLRQVLSLTYCAGARPAERGEFTKRAFLNGRLDLSQAQAVMDVIQAKTDSALRAAEGNLSGKFSAKIREMRNEILGVIAHLEALIDFPEEDVEDISLEDARKTVAGLADRLRRLLQTAHAGQILREGLMTAIIGRPNVGKSSLLNMLLRTERAIVTDIPGTTRDSIEEYADIGGVPLRIIDTAGIRATEDKVERIGVEKSREYAEQAALLLVLFDGSQELSAEDEEILALLEGKQAILLVNKSDLPQKVDPGILRQRFPDFPVLPISTKAENGLESLQKAILDKVYTTGCDEEETTLVRDEREAHLLRRVLDHLNEAINAMDGSMDADLVSIDLRSAWEILGELTGEMAGEDIIDEIFSRFCIGK